MMDFARMKMNSGFILHLLKTNGNIHNKYIGNNFINIDKFYTYLYFLDFGLNRKQ